MQLLSLREKLKEKCEGMNSTRFDCTNPKISHDGASVRLEMLDSAS